MTIPLLKGEERLHEPDLTLVVLSIPPHLFSDFCLIIDQRWQGFTDTHPSNY